jgi:hypothetical protein
MIGLLGLAILALWVAASVWIARRIARAIPMKASGRPWAAAALFVVVFLLPVGDELAARPYFATLCRKGAVLRINAEKVKGRSLILTIDPSHAPVQGTPIPVFHSHYEYRDKQTGELLAEYELYSAQGGVLARLVGLNEAYPLTGTLFCAPEERVSMKTRYGFDVLN